MFMYVLPRSAYANQSQREEWRPDTKAHEEKQSLNRCLGTDMPQLTQTKQAS